MRKFFFLFFAFLSIETQGQMITDEQVQAYANELVHLDFLTPKGKELLLNEIAKGAIEIDHPSTVNPITYTSSTLSREIILQFCYMAISSELMHRLDKEGWKIESRISPKESLDDTMARTYSLMDGLGGRKGYLNCISSQTSTFGYTRLKTLTTFLKSGLIDQMVFNDCKKALQLKQLRDEVQLIRYMLDRSTYYRYYDFNKREQENYISNLLSHGILNPEGKDSLLKSLNNYRLYSIPEILAPSPRYIIADLNDFEPDPKIAYPVIFEKVKNLLPGFNYTNLKVEILEEKESDLIRQDVKLSFNVDANRYSHTFFHDYRKQKPTRENTDDEPSRVDQDFHKGINKWLTDIESPFRVYTINIRKEGESIYGGKSVGLLLLKQGEDSLFTGDPYLISSESYDQRLSRKNIDILIEKFNHKGFFSHLTSIEREAAKVKITGADINNIEDVLFQFPNTIVAFDWETGNLENPYEQLTKELMMASRGAFEVVNIVDDFKKGWKKAKQVKYGFTLNGKRYEKMLKFDGDWLDPDFFELLQSALKDNKINGQYYYCIDDGQVGGYIFLTSEQYKFIQESYPDLLKGE